VNDERWPGEERLLSVDDEELGPEVAEDEVELAPGEEELAEAEAEVAPEEEQVDEPPAEEDELPRLRTADHAAGELDIPTATRSSTVRPTAGVGLSASSSAASTARSPTDSSKRRSTS
jgi:hypothetical protein